MCANWFLLHFGPTNSIWFAYGSLDWVDSGSVCPTTGYLVHVGESLNKVSDNFTTFPVLPLDSSKLKGNL